MSLMSELVTDWRHDTARDTYRACEKYKQSFRENKGQLTTVARNKFAIKAYRRFIKIEDAILSTFTALFEMIMDWYVSVLTGKTIDSANLRHL